RAQRRLPARWRATETERARDRPHRCPACLVAVRWLCGWRLRCRRAPAAQRGIRPGLGAAGRALGVRRCRRTGGLTPATQPGRVAAACGRCVYDRAPGRRELRDLCADHRARVAARWPVRGMGAMELVWGGGDLGHLPAPVLPDRSAAVAALATGPLAGDRLPERCRGW